MAQNFESSAGEIQQDFSNLIRIDNSYKDHSISEPRDSVVFNVEQLQPELQENKLSPVNHQALRSSKSSGHLIEKDEFVKPDHRNDKIDQSGNKRISKVNIREMHDQEGEDTFSMINELNDILYKEQYKKEAPNLVASSMQLPPYYPSPRAQMPIQMMQQNSYFSSIYPQGQAMEPNTGNKQLNLSHYTLNSQLDNHSQMSGNFQKNHRTHGAFPLALSMNGGLGASQRFGNCNIVHTSVTDFHGSCIHTQQVDSLTHELQEFRKELRQVQKENALLSQKVNQANQSVQEFEKKEDQLKEQHRVIVSAMEKKNGRLQTDIEKLDLLSQGFEEELTKVKSQTTLKDQLKTNDVQNLKSQLEMKVKEIEQIIHLHSQSKEELARERREKQDEIDRAQHLNIERIHELRIELDKANKLREEFILQEQTKRQTEKLKLVKQSELKLQKLKDQNRTEMHQNNIQNQKQLSKLQEELEIMKKGQNSDVIQKHLNKISMLQKSLKLVKLEMSSKEVYNNSLQIQIRELEAKLNGFEIGKPIKRKVGSSKGAKPTLSSRESSQHRISKEKSKNSVKSIKNGPPIPRASKKTQESLVMIQKVPTINIMDDEEDETNIVLSNPRDQLLTTHQDTIVCSSFGLDNTYFQKTVKIDLSNHLKNPVSQTGSDHNTNISRSKLHEQFEVEKQKMLEDMRLEVRQMLVAETKNFKMDSNNHQSSIETNSIDLFTERPQTNSLRRPLTLQNDVKKIVCEDQIQQSSEYQLINFPNDLNKENFNITNDPRHEIPELRESSSSLDNAEVDQDEEIMPDDVSLNGTFDGRYQPIAAYSKFQNQYAVNLDKPKDNFFENFPKQFDSKLSATYRSRSLDDKNSSPPLNMRVPISQRYQKDFHPFKQRFQRQQEEDCRDTDNELELFQQESDMKQQFNLSQQMSQKEGHIKDKKFHPELFMKNQNSKILTRNKFNHLSSSLSNREQVQQPLIRPPEAQKDLDREVYISHLNQELRQNEEPQINQSSTIIPTSQSFNVITGSSGKMIIQTQSSNNLRETFINKNRPGTSQGGALPNLMSYQVPQKMNRPGARAILSRQKSMKNQLHLIQKQIEKNNIILY